VNQSDNYNYRRNRFTEWLGRNYLKLVGWQISGELPKLDKFVIIAAHHTSNWDFIVLMAVKFQLYLHARWFGKHTLFRFPFGALLKRLGGVPIRRHLKQGVVEQAIDEFNNRQQFVLAITPEGTRKKVERWKMGFYHIAYGAGVPIVLVAVDYPRRRVVLGPAFYPTGDEAIDMQQILAFYRDFIPKKPEYALTYE